MKHLFTIVLLLTLVYANAQVKIGTTPGTIDPNSLLELESSDKGFLGPRVTLVALDDVAPLTAPVPAGMLIYNTGGAVAKGYYYWDGAQWATFTQSNMVSKVASTTLTKTETFVLASGDITLTLPDVTPADNGLTITIKHIGTHTDQVVVAVVAGETNDGVALSKLYRWLSRTFVAYNGNWIRKDKEAKTNNVFDVSSTGSWTTITEALEFLDLHMPGPSVIRLSGETYVIDATQEIDLPFGLTIEGVSYGATIIEADPALGANPMFRCVSESYFKKIAFDGSGTTGEDAIQLEGPGEYYEIKDCSFESFNKTIVLETNVELWLFETDISDAVVAGVEVAAGTVDFAKLTASECDFTNCAKGISLLSGDTAKTNIVNCTFYNSAGQVGIAYDPAGFTRFSSLFITNNAWNNIGSFTSGFDFSRADGRDKNAFLQNNAGDGDKNPSMYLNVTNNLTTTVLTTSTTWYKVNWDFTKCDSSTTNWAVTNAAGGIANVNRIRYQPSNRRDGYITISGNIQCNSTTPTINIAIVKNPGAATSALATGVVRYGETTLRTPTANVPFQFSTVIYLSNVGPDDVFEIWANASSLSPIITIQDLQMLVNTK